MNRPPVRPWTKPPNLPDAWWVLIRRLRGRPITLPSCPNCGYPAVQLIQFICPECGNDLEKTGVIDPLLIRSFWAILVPCLILWSFFVFTSSCALRSTIDRHVLERYYPGELREIVLQIGGPSYRVDMYIFGQTDSYFLWPWSSRDRKITSLRMVAFAGGQYHTGTFDFANLQLDLQNGSYSTYLSYNISIDKPVTKGSVSTGTSLSPEVFADWAHRKTILEHLPNRDAVVPGIYQLVRAADGTTTADFQQRLINATPSASMIQAFPRTTYITARFPPGGEYLRSGFWWLLWLAGILILLRCKLFRQRRNGVELVSKVI